MATEPVSSPPTANAVRETNFRSESSALRLGRAPHYIVVRTAVELGARGLLLLVFFLGRSYSGAGRTGGRDPSRRRCIATHGGPPLGALDDRKQVWLVIGFAAGLAYLGRQYALSAKPRF